MLSDSLPSTSALIPALFLHINDIGLVQPASTWGRHAPPNTNTSFFFQEKNVEIHKYFLLGKSHKNAELRLRERQTQRRKCNNNGVKAEQRGKCSLCQLFPCHGFVDLKITLRAQQGREAEQRAQVEEGDKQQSSAGVKKKQQRGRAEATRQRQRWRSGGARRPVPSRQRAGKQGRKEKRSDTEEKEGEEAAGHGALCGSPHLSVPG